MSILNLEGVSTGTPLNSLIRPTPFLKRLKTNRQDAVFIAIVLAHQVGKQVAAYLNLNISDISQILLWTHLEKYSLVLRRSEMPAGSTSLHLPRVHSSNNLQDFLLPPFSHVVS